MRLTEENKKRIDEWFNDRSADEIIYLSKKYGLVKESGWEYAKRNLEISNNDQ